MDALIVILASMAFTFHWFQTTKFLTLAFYALDAFFIYASFLRTFAISAELGPKMVMIKKMVSARVVM